MLNLFHLFTNKFFIFITTGQRITTIQLEGVQYFVSRMNPYSPELNYFLAYQYCRSLGLQLASFETKEKVESMSQYLQNAGYSKYDFWTSGNRLGTGMFLWMSTGLPFNATFDYFENTNDAVKAGLLDPIDHNSNTAPQRTARDRYLSSVSYIYFVSFKKNPIFSLSDYYVRTFVIDLNFPFIFFILCSNWHNQKPIVSCEQ